MKNWNLKGIAKIAIAMILPIMLANGAQAQGTRVLEEIVVTAAYREQGLQDVPVSITAVTGDKLAFCKIDRCRDTNAGSFGQQPHNVVPCRCITRYAAFISGVRITADDTFICTI